MSKKEKNKKKDPLQRHLYVADYETTVDEDTKSQELTQVWSAAICPVLKRPEPSDATVYNNIFQFIDHLEKLEDESIVYFHNAKFDLSFLLNELNHYGYKPAYDPKAPSHYMADWQQDKTQYTYKVTVSALGMWYGCRLRMGDRSIQIVDSAKKIPSTLERIGKDFDTKYKKLEMEYTGARQPFGIITDEEMQYIINDVLVLSEAMYIVYYEYGMYGPTIAHDALEEFKKLTPDYDILFPDMNKFSLAEQGGPDMTPYEYCYNAYSGGWCWKNPVADNKIYKADIKYTPEIEAKLKKMYKKLSHLTIVKHIFVIDVNSLYPSCMIESDNNGGYPVGNPTFHNGAPTADEVEHCAIFRRFKCRFKKKAGMLPFIHIHKPGYNYHECLNSSVDSDGNDPIAMYTMAQPEFELFKKHYELLDYEPVDYLTFERRKGIFDVYIEKYRKMKIEAVEEGNKAKKAIAKLFLNSLYGKLSSNTDSSYKTITFVDDVMKFTTYEENEKKPVYIPAGAYITAYARSFTITAGQSMYYEGQDRGVMYADTDSLHVVDVTIDELKANPAIKIHKSNFLCWACEESSVALATYAKQKTYIEVSTEEDFKTVTDKKGNPDIAFVMKGAGLSDNGKQFFMDCMDLDTTDQNKVFVRDENTGKVYSEDDKHVAKLTRTTRLSKLYLDNYRAGLTLHNVNLKAKQIKGGILLVPDDFSLN